MAACFATTMAQAATNLSFGTDWGSNIYSFDLDTPSVPATTIITTSNAWPDCITISPDGKTVYVTFNNPFKATSDVYSFPVVGPYVATALGTGVVGAIGIAISSDGLTGFICRDTNIGSTTPGIWSFPIGGSFPHTATELNAIGDTIATPTFIVISGDTAYVGEYVPNSPYGNIYSFSVSDAVSTGNYDATVIQTNTDLGASVNGLAVSSDGYLYISSNSAGNVTRVPLSSPKSSPQTVARGFPTSLDGLAVSDDGTTVYVASEFGSKHANPGIYSFPTNQGFPQTPTLLSGLDLSGGVIALAIAPAPLEPPASLTASQKKNNFGSVYELYNLLQWQASPSPAVVGYIIYRNGIQIASVDASTFTYQDHNREKNVTVTYSVTTIDSTGDQSAPITVVIN